MTVLWSILVDRPGSALSNRQQGEAESGRAPGFSQNPKRI